MFPVVFVHGILAHDRKDRAKFWGQIPRTLADRELRVFMGKTDAWGNYESNAAILKKTIETVLTETKQEKVNIIAHSKGGIDARYLLWNYNFGCNVASLTTICTPHRGSEIADLLFRQKIVHSALSKKALTVFGGLCGDHNPDVYKVNAQLTTENMSAFNSAVPPDSGVYFQSLYTTMNSAFDDPVFYYTYRYIKKISGANDGVVSELSARWGPNVRKIPGGISHAEILDVKQKTISGITIPNVYVEIVKDLAARGF